MDYCSSCHRTLNGALVCPGCGAYAPDIAPPGHDSHHASATTATPPQPWHTQEFPAPGAGDDGGDAPRLATAPFRLTAASYPLGGAEDAMTDTSARETAAAAAAGTADEISGASGTGQPESPELSERPGCTEPATPGRAARRRQLARWKKQRRRAVVASTVALVGGGLTLAVLPSRPSAGPAQAASAPEPAASAPTSVDGTETDSSSVRPRARDTREPGADASPSTVNDAAISGSSRKTDTAVAGGAEKSRRQTTAVVTRSTAPASPEQRTTPVTADVVPPAAEPPAPRTTTPEPPPSAPPADDSGADTTAPANPEASTPADPADPAKPPREQLCLLVLCVG
ncbi:SCO2400 family protein [Streptomyces hebeiensis]